MSGGGRQWCSLLREACLPLAPWQETGEEAGTRSDPGRSGESPVTGRRRFLPAPPGGASPKGGRLRQ